MVALGSARVREAVRHLQEAIASGRWPVNSRIPNEADLAAELGVGRSTVREAVGSLARLGMLEPAPGRGTFVRSLSPVYGVLSDFAGQHSWADLLAVRKALEVQAAELAAVRRDPGAAEALHQLRAAHAADVEGSAGTERGAAPGQFHSLMVAMAQNRLLEDLYAALMSALRSGVAAHQVCSGQVAEVRWAEHEALLAAIAVGNGSAAAAVAAAHADHDLREVKGAVDDG